MPVTSVLMKSMSRQLEKARSVNQTSTSFVSKVPTNTEPTGDAATATGASVIQLSNGTGTAPNLLHLLPYGAGSDNNTFSVRIIGWDYVGQNPLTRIWIPVLLAELLCTLDTTLVGVAGKAIVATEYFCDTISLTAGNANVSCDITSSADGVSVASALVDLKGHDRWEASFTTGSSATSCNALYRYL